MEIVSKPLEAYASQFCTPESPLFEELKKVTYAKTEYPQMQVGRIEGSLLRILARSVRARRVLEIGTFTGYSSLCFAEAIPEDGEVITCDIDPDATGIAREFWAKSPHGKKIHLRLGPATETLSQLTGTFDVAFIDADKDNYPTYWKLIAPKIRPGGMVMIDNVLWSGAVIEPNPDEETRAIMETCRLASSDPKFETSLLTVRDGVLIALKRP